MWLWYDEMINLKNVVFINQKLKYDHFINRIAGTINRFCIEKKSEKKNRKKKSSTELFIVQNILQIFCCGGAMAFGPFILNSKW